VRFSTGTTIRGICVGDRSKRVMATGQYALTAAVGEQFNKLKNFKLANNLHAISLGIDLILFQVSCFLVNPPILPNELQR
jgi:hypothetical protein